MKVKLINDNFKQDYFINLLKARGVVGVEGYLHPTDACLLDPKDLENIDAGAELLKSVLDRKGRILLVVDSDCDGFTSATIIYKYIKAVYPDIIIDHLLHEGKQHGLQDHIDHIMESGIKYDLIILPDSSSNDATYHEQLRGINLPCLILDHHLTDVAISDNAVVINNQLSPKYENKALTGAGVVYQFCRYLDMKWGLNNANRYIDLAALGIIGDMGSILEPENRYIIAAGLTNINNYFFKCLIDKQAFSLKDGNTPIGIAFYIVPLINAMVRAGTMEEKERMFLAFTDGMKQIVSKKRGAKGSLERAAVECARECGNIRNRQNKIKENAVASIEQKIYKHDLLSNKILFVRLDEDDDFPAELNGLVAMELSKKFKHPTIVARRNEEGFDRGSIRGLEHCVLDDFKAFLTDSGYFEYIQGHANAAGCSIADRNLDAFHKYANEKLKDVDFGEDSFEVDFIRSAMDKDLEALIEDVGCHNDVWGTGNTEPKIYIHDINITSDEIQVMGKNQDTIKFTKNGVTYIAFFAKEFLMELQQYKEIKLNVIGKGGINEWRGRTNPQVIIESYEVSDGYLSF